MTTPGGELRLRRSKESEEDRLVATEPGVAPTLAASLPDVATRRLDLRRFRSDDVDELAAVFAKPEVWNFPYGRGLTRSETESFVESQIEHCEGFGVWLLGRSPDRF